MEKNTKDSWIKDPLRRKRVFDMLSLLFVVLVPWLGFMPLFIMMLISLVLTKRENTSKAMNVFYLVLITITSCLLALNLWYFIIELIDLFKSMN